MRIVHFSDSHLGYTAYRRLNSEGYNQRGEDICQSFRQSVNKILELKPDLVLYAGDLFDSPRPLNRMITFAYEQLMRFKKAGIPFVLISGNHETPKQKGIGSIFSLLEVFTEDNNRDKNVSHKIIPGQIYAVYKGCYERLLFQDLLIHAVPHCTDQEAFQGELQKIKLDNTKKNIGLFHAGVKGLKEFREGDFNEQLIDYDFFNKHKFDYIALGHLHRMVEVSKNAWYAGSTERLSFNEVNQAKGFLEVESEDIKIKPHYLEVRPMQEIAEIDASQLNSEQTMRLITERLSKFDPAEKICRLKLKKIKPETYTALDFGKIRELTAKAVHFETIFEKQVDEEIGQQGGDTIKGLREEFLSYLVLSAPGPQYEFIRTKGLELLTEVIE